MSKIRSSLVGERFGDLTVIEFDHMDKNHHSCWLCQCDCGNQIVVARDHLVTGNTLSCGCRKLSPRYEDISGKRFGRLTVICFDHINKHKQSCWLCQCDCGNRLVVVSSSLRSGNTSSCGCYKKELTQDTKTTHGLSGTRLYKVWQDMRTRCENENYDAYHRYGGRGIRVCDDWKKFENFKEWTDISGYTEGLTLDRINNNEDYCPENCRWTDWHTQNNNRSSNRNIEYHGIVHTVADWARLFNMPYTTLQTRIRKGDMRDFIKYFDKK